MRPEHEYRRALDLVSEGFNDCEISREMGIPRGTIRDWRLRKVRAGPWKRRQPHARSFCPRCGEDRRLPEDSYAYLLGLYLGDGYLAPHPRGVFKLRIFLDQRYLFILRECARAIALVRGKDTVGFVEKIGCMEVICYWKHWPCLFPQHGPGQKHKRVIRLDPWQELIVRNQPKKFVAGLIHSDGCRDMNVVNGTPYPRYQFVNHSSDIRGIFCEMLDRLGIHWTVPYWKTVSISRRPDVAFLDEFVGPKA